MCYRLTTAERVEMAGGAHSIGHLVDPYPAGEAQLQDSLWPHNAAPVLLLTHHERGAVRNGRGSPERRQHDLRTPKP